MKPTRVRLPAIRVNVSALPFAVVAHFGGGLAAEGAVNSAFVVIIAKRAQYTERLAEAGIEPSVGSVGDSYDNALAERIIGLFKTAVIRKRGPWHNLEAVEFATLEWANWFNHRRLLQPIGDVPPAEKEEAYYQQISESALAA